MSEKSNGERAGPSTSSVQRLPTWKAPRDLTLASLSNNLKASAAPTTKKTFMPNLNVQRKKNAEPTPASKVKKEITNAKQDKAKFDRKKKDAKSMIQTTSVFSEGIAASEKKKSSSFYHGEGESKANLPPPKLNLERNKLVDKSVDEKTLQTLLRDDFINDDFDEADLDSKSDVKDRRAPVQLPLVKTEPKTEEEKKLESPSGKLSHLLAESELLSQSADESGNKFLFFQFPDSIAVSTTTSDNKETASHSMKEISSGRLGTIQIMKSGKVRLVQGDKSYVIAQSTNTSFLQDVVSCCASPETNTGTLTSLGPVMSRFLVAPDWDSL